MSQRASARFCFWESIVYSVLLAATIVVGLWFCINAESFPNPLPWPVAALLMIIPGAPVAFFTCLSWGAYALTKEEESK